MFSYILCVSNYRRSTALLFLDIMSENADHDGGHRNQFVDRRRVGPIHNVVDQPARAREK